MAKEESTGAKLAKVVLLIGLVALAGWLGARRLGQARVDWLLGSISKGDDTALKRLADMGDDALPYIERELRSTNADSRLVAVIALGALRTEGAMRLLAEAARDPDAITAANALAAIGARGGPMATRVIMDALDDKRERVRLVARREAGRRTGLPWWAFGRPKREDAKG